MSINARIANGTELNYETRIPKHSNRQLRRHSYLNTQYIRKKTTNILVIRTGVVGIENWLVLPVTGILFANNHFYSYDFLDLVAMV